MIGGTVTHLRPGVSSVAVGAEQPQIASVGLPVAQAIVPGSRTALLKFPVDVINVESAKVSLATINARPAKFRNQRQLPTPVAGMLVPLVRVDRPISVPALVAAKAMLARFSALLTILAPFPARRKIAVAAAILPGAVPQSVEMSFKRLGAVRADNFNGALFHARNIARKQRQPKYFDIACKRIEDAQRQGDFFVDAAA